MPNYNAPLSRDSDRPILTVLPDLVSRQAIARPNKAAFIFEGNKMTYAQLDKGSSRIANGLLSLCLKPNDRVAHLGKNSHHYYELLIGVSKSGGVLCPINWRLADPELEYILNDFKPTIMFIGKEFIDIVSSLKSEVPSIEHIICMEECDQDFPSYANWREQFEDNPPNVKRLGTDDALQIYTSGTTGLPKGAVLSSRSMLTPYKRYRGHAIPEWNVWTEDDISLISMPCFHIAGTLWGLTGIAHGATGVIMRNFVPAAVLDYIDEYRISKLFMVPAALQIIADQPRALEVDFSQLKFILYGASPMPLPLLERSMDVFKCGFAQFYGMTETSGTLTALPPEDHDVNGNQRMLSVGKPLRGVELVIFDDTGQALNSGEIGEVATRSPMNMNGYWNLPEATNSTLSADGWLRTGDIGYLDADGYLFLKDRKKDMIISGGENIYPAEVENAIFEHPKVADVSVIGVPDRKWGEVAMACVVLKSGQSLSEDEIIAWTRERIASFKCPKSVDFMDLLPRNPSGKVLRRKLREPYLEDPPKTQ